MNTRRALLWYTAFSLCLLAVLIVASITSRTH